MEARHPYYSNSAAIHVRSIFRCVGSRIYSSLNPRDCRANQGAWRGLGVNKRPSAADEQQQQAIEQDSKKFHASQVLLAPNSSSSSARARLAMFLALAIALVLSGAESSLATSVERAGGVNKREQGKPLEFEEDPGVWIRTDVWN